LLYLTKFYAYSYIIVMKLVIVESPAKAKTIQKYLGSPYQVEASVGHIRDLPKSEKGAIDIDAGYVPHYIIPENKKEIIDMEKLGFKSKLLFSAWIFILRWVSPLFLMVIWVLGNLERIFFIKFF